MNVIETPTLPPPVTEKFLPFDLELLTFAACLNKNASDTTMLTFIESLFSSPETIRLIEEKEFPSPDDIENLPQGIVFKWQLGYKTMSIGFVYWIDTPTAFYSLRDASTGSLRHFFPVEAAEIKNIVKNYAHEKAQIKLMEKAPNE